MRHKDDVIGMTDTKNVDINGVVHFYYNDNWYACGRGRHTSMKDATPPTSYVTCIGCMAYALAGCITYALAT